MMSSSSWNVFVSVFLVLTAPWGLVQAATFTVTNTSDSGAGSLREAILDANGNAGPDTIAFNIPTSDPNFVDVDAALVGGDAAADVYVITPLSVLPALSDVTGGTRIDGQTQTSFGGDTNPFGPEIVLDGSVAGGAAGTGFTLISNGNWIFSLNIQSFGSAGIIIQSSNNWVAANYVGTDATGTAARGNNTQLSFSGGVVVTGVSNVIGTNGDGIADVAERNIISGNNRSGVLIFTNQNVVAGNFIGTDRTGTVAVPNGTAVFMLLGAQANVIGTNGDGVADTAERNIISGNGGTGVQILGDGPTNENIVAGNFIGTDVTGTLSLGNGRWAVTITSSGGPNKSARNNRIGTNGDGLADAAERNIMSGNGFGLLIGSAGAEQNIVAGNFIGTDVTGTVAMGNLKNSVTINNGAHHNLIGTNGDGVADAAERNIVSGNGQGGVNITGGANHNVVAGNFIGTDVTGTVGMGNQHSGVAIITGAHSNLIGTNGDGMGDDAERNIISANGDAGVLVVGNLNVIAGNLIGTDITGSAALPNFLGVWIISGDDNTIGGTATSESNVIAFNVLDGVFVQAGPGTGNAILSNSIFSNTGLGIDLGQDGVTLNDPEDDDTGVNNLQNFPVLTSASTGGVQGTLNSTPNTAFLLEFFANSTCDSSGFGEGETFLGSTNVSTDGSGNTNFTGIFPVPLGTFVTATATDPNNNTSEFSGCDVEVVALEVPVDIKPQSCPNPLNVKSGGVLPVAILGTTDFDVTRVDSVSVRLAGVAPLRSTLEDVATPFVPFIGKVDAFDCTTSGPDGYLDLTLKFRKKDVIAAIGPANDGDVVVLELTGSLTDGSGIVGEDIMVILK